MMKFADPLVEGRFIKRYKRFFADIQRDGEIITAHVPNTGSMKGCLIEGAPCRFTINNNPKRKLKYTLQMIKIGKTWVGVNTNLPNSMVWEAFESRAISHWEKFQWGRKEVPINNSSRIDLVLWNHTTTPHPNKKMETSWFKNTKNGVFHFVEVKNVTLEVGNSAQFPDAITTRGQRHLIELIKLVEVGHSAEIFFTIQRNDCDHFSPADGVDPEYGRLLREAKKAGVLISPYPCRIKKSGITIDGAKKLKIKL